MFVEVLDLVSTTISFFVCIHCSDLGQIYFLLQYVVGKSDKTKFFCVSILLPARTNEKV